MLNAAAVSFGMGTGNLNFNHTATNYVFAIPISGNGAVNVFSGTTVLAGINTYSGVTTVKSGTLIVDGSIASSSLTTVSGGGTLGGSGTVGATSILSGGTFAPGPSGTPGTMTVAGNLAFQSGALYVVQVNPTTASTTNVSGTASLAGTVQANFLAGSFVNRSYTILTVAGGRSGTFDALTISGLPANFQASLSYAGNTAVLNLTAQLVPPPNPPTPPGPDVPSPPAFTVNQLNVGNAIDNFFNNGGRLPPAFVPLFALTGGNLTHALDQLSGEAATGAQRVGFRLTDQFLNLMLDPFVDGRSGIGGGADHPALGFARERDSTPPEIALAYASVFKAPPNAPPIYEPRWTAWGGAYGGSNRTSGDLAVIGSHDVSTRTVGVAGGLDYRLTPDTVMGFAFAGGGTDWGLSQGLGGGKSDAFQAGVYGATRSGPAYLAAAFAFANHWMSTDRFAFAGDHLTANFNAQSIGGRVEGGYRFGWIFGGFTPYAAIQAQSFRTPEYSETDVNGGGFGLSYVGRTATDTRSELGARFDNQMLLYPGAVLALRARLAWAHDWVTDPILAAAFQTLPGASFIVSGATPAQNSALASAGAELRLANGISLLGKFDGEFASHSTTYGGTGTIRYRW
jgi:outer membrane autotransporter protein